MRHKWLNTLALFLIIAMSSSLSCAQSVYAEQKKLAEYQQQLSVLQAQQQQLQANIQKNTLALQPLLQTKSPEQALLSEAQEQLDEAKRNFQTENSPDNQARINNAEFKYALAERKFNKANTDVVELQERASALNSQLTATNNKATELSSQIATQRALIDKLKTQQASSQSQQNDQQKLSAAAAAQAEIARLKAQLKQQELEAEAEIERARKEAAAPAPAATVNTSPVPAAPATVVKKNSQAVPPATTSSQDTKGIILLNSAEQVRAEESKLEQLLATTDTSKEKRHNKILNVKAIGNNGATGPAEANSLRSLGHDVYRGTVTLSNGNNLFSIGFNRWEQQITAAGNGVKFDVIYDESDAKNPRLIYYPSALGSSLP